jgi:hypothetical protein
MLFHVLNVLYFYISTSRSMCVVPSMAVFCSYVISCFLCMFLKCFLWVILKWFLLPLKWLVSSLVLHSKYTVFVLYWSYLCLIIIIIIIISNAVWSHLYCVLSTNPTFHTFFRHLFRLSISFYPLNDHFSNMLLRLFSYVSVFDTCVLLVSCCSLFGPRDVVSPRK